MSLAFLILLAIAISIVVCSAVTMVWFLWISGFAWLIILFGATVVVIFLVLLYLFYRPTKYGTARLP